MLLYVQVEITNYLKRMSIKLYITAIESRPDGTAVTLFEDLLVTKTKDQLEFDSDSPDTIESFVLDKIKEVEAINNQTTSPF